MSMPGMLPANVTAYPPRRWISAATNISPARATCWGFIPAHKLMLDRNQVWILVQGGTHSIAASGKRYIWCVFASIMIRTSLPSAWSTRQGPGLNTTDFRYFVVTGA
jgi:hypothetical protein